ncbi:hypothetical protein N7457_007953 [Penicillium paradoxum]|uniref:uncharacterized protein n=1 Tax=Penicillium paradoxum TaxID=176176 RepID=UPI00254928C9|nr:uncharacterized protein N7457_007953 [Penicillium paradoxum]KAJ5773057.1 hypothetical protein N7457_007953 [Penicillium paradoxum]
MPHHSPMGFQALILCGPGGSLNTFTSRPEEYPKCLMKVANRPMIFYAIDFCKRSGITDITLITPPLAFPPLRAALDQNPYLTLPSLPSVSLIAPKHLEMTMGTAELLRLPEVQKCIKSDFLLLPCDIICDLPAESILEAWIATQGAIQDTSNSEKNRDTQGPTTSYFDIQQQVRRGGLAVYYQTDNREESVPQEATDFVAIGPLDQDTTRVVPPPQGPARPRFALSKLLMTMPMDTIKEKMKADKALLLRYSLVQSCGQVKLLTTFRDAHIYALPLWVKDLVQYQRKLESVSEDLIGNWAKSGWQKGLGDKMGLTKIFGQDDYDPQEPSTPDSSYFGAFIDKDVDLRRMTTTKSCLGPESPGFKSCFRTPRSAAAIEACHTTELPQMLAYVHRGSTPFIRRVDSSAILLSTSLLLAKLPSIEEVGRKAASPFAHVKKISYPEGIASPSAITAKDCLLDDNVIVEPTVVIKESVIGAKCHISRGARLIRCVVMDEAVIESRAELTGCVIGHRARIGRECVLRNCEVQDAYVIPRGTTARDEKLMVYVTLSE